MERKIRGLIRVFKQLPYFILNEKRSKLRIKVKSRIKKINLLFIKKNSKSKFKMRELMCMDSVCVI